jgi:hypothetical protein
LGLLALFFAGLLCHNNVKVLAQQEAPLAVQYVEVSKEGEVGLEVEARSAGASWARKGAEAAALLIEVDGNYNQDLLLWAGDAPFYYRVTLGRLARGKHTVIARLNRSRSAAAAQQATVLSLRPIQFADSSQSTADELLALANSPILYERANTIDHFSDVPLLMYYEVFHPGDREVKIRYTAIFTNEDGGTPTAALMARWGRGTDIEWVYEFRAREGKIVEENYQAVDHETKQFNGKRTNGGHPLLAVASDNNNFSDLACSAVRFALLPIAADLHSRSRESVMDTNPWTYRVMAEELVREGRIRDVPADINSISDPRDYLYVELSANPRGASVSVDVNSKGKTLSSDLGEPRLRIDRSGYSRTAIRLDSPATAASVSSVVIRCYATQLTVEERACQGVQVKSLIVLDRNYTPLLVKFQELSPQTLRPGETLEVKVRP